MATYNKFYDFLLQLGKGVHHLHAAGDALKVYLSDATPDAALHTVKANIAEIASAGGYAGAQSISNDYTLIGTNPNKKGTLTGADVTFTCTGAGFPQFRYAILYNDTPTSPADPLIAWFDYTLEVNLGVGESFKVDFAPAAIFEIGP